MSLSQGGPLPPSCKHLYSSFVTVQKVVTANDVVQSHTAVGGAEDDAQPEEAAVAKVPVDASISLVAFTLLG